MANKLDFTVDSGVQEISINGKVSIYENLTDINFVERVFDTFDAMDKQQDKYQAVLKNESDTKIVFETAHRMDAEMRDLINGLFNTDICTPVFGNMNVYAMAGGLPIWCNLMLCLIECMNDTFSEEKKQTNPKLQKYLAKFKK